MSIDELFGISSLERARDLVLKYSVLRDDHSFREAMECLVFFAAAAAICIIVEPVMPVLMLFLAFLTMGVTRLTTEPLKRSTDRFADSAAEYMAEIQDDFDRFRPLSLISARQNRCRSVLKHCLP